MGLGGREGLVLERRVLKKSIREICTMYSSHAMPTLNWSSCKPHGSSVR